MLFYRKAFEKLKDWKDKSKRKPLIIRGARQVGKSTLVRQFSSLYKYYIELNLEKEEIRKLFEEIDDVRSLMDVVYINFKIPKSNEPILLFIDEIQESPKAIQKLRYFYEEMPELHVIAAGSLLEFALKYVASFPVGRVEHMVLHPLDFEEFLLASNNEAAVNELNSIPCNNYAFDTMINLFNTYIILGGMPEVVLKYQTDKSMANTGSIYDFLWQNYKDDSEKYASNTTERNILRHILNTASGELERIKFEGFGNSNYRSREVSESFRALDMARIIRLIYPSTSIEIPMNTNIRKRPKLQFLDTGLLNYLLNIQSDMIGVKDINKILKGRIVQHVAVQEMIAQFDSPLFKPHFWVKESPKSNAEVDILFQYSRYLIPIEVKSGAHGKLRSLHQFMEMTNHPYAIRLLSNKLTVENVTTVNYKKFFLLNLPYYLAAKIPQYCAWFVKNYSLE